VGIIPPSDTPDIMTVSSFFTKKVINKIPPHILNINNMGKFINRLNDMFSEVVYDLPLFTTVYEFNNKRGEITYEQKNMVGQNKPIRQNVLILVSANMDGIIDQINNITPLSEDDFNEIRKDIMENSLNHVKNYQINNPTL
jgi:hypothetical protein